MAKTWCAQHRDGWCAVHDGDELEDNALSANTLCGMIVILPWCVEKREPDCVECMELVGEQ